jgi:hypothetical protein
MCALPLPPGAVAERAQGEQGHPGGESHEADGEYDPAVGAADAIGTPLGLGDLQRAKRHHRHRDGEGQRGAGEEHADAALRGWRSGAQRRRPGRGMSDARGGGGRVARLRRLHQRERQQCNEGHEVRSIARGRSREAAACALRSQTQRLRAVDRGLSARRWGGDDGGPVVVRDRGSGRPHQPGGSNCWHAESMTLTAASKNGA